MYIEHDANCNIFKDTYQKNNGCDCYARFARAPMIMGPHEAFCPYLSQMGPNIPTHGICYCSAHPDHDELCDGMICWDRRKGLLPRGARIMEISFVREGTGETGRIERIG